MSAKPITQGNKGRKRLSPAGIADSNKLKNIMNTPKSVSEEITEMKEERRVYVDLAITSRGAFYDARTTTPLAP